MKIKPPSEIEITQIAAGLSAQCPQMAGLISDHPWPQWRVRDGGLEGLLRMVVDQQVSVAAGQAIWNRLVEGLGGQVTPAALLAHDVEGLRGFGLSRPKAGYARGVAEAILDGRLDFARLQTLDDEAAIAHLVQLKGLGRWSAEVYLMFCEARRDLFPADDLAILEGLRRLKGLEARPTPKLARAMAEIWAPHRTFASFLLWSHYARTNDQAKQERLEDKARNPRSKTGVQ